MNTDFWMTVILPICVCVVLPVLIVFIVGRVRQNETNRKTEVMLKALENGTPIDPEFFKSPKKAKKARTTKEKLLDNLTGACVTGGLGLAFVLLGALGVMDNGSFMITAGAVLLAIGLANLVVFIIGRNMMSKEIEAEEKQIPKDE